MLRCPSFQHHGSGPVSSNCLCELVSYIPVEKLESKANAMDVKSLIERLIVRLWNRQYYLAFHASDTPWTRLQRKGLTRIAELLTERLKQRM